MRMMMKPIRQAAVVVPVCGRQVLILERASHLRFQPNFHSFPGGVMSHPMIVPTMKVLDRLWRAALRFER